MKKTIGKIVAVILVAIMAMAMIACGKSEPSVTANGTWDIIKVIMFDIEQGKCINGLYTAMTTYSDNTFSASAGMDGYYSSDGGETYNPVVYLNLTFYGTYEVVSVDEELGDTTIRIKEITRVVKGDYDTDKSMTDEDKAFMQSYDWVGKELILSSDHKLSEYVSAYDWAQFGTNSLAW